eukprot:366062-Chlamydomonas_euryale.AAC.6
MQGTARVRTPPHTHTPKPIDLPRPVLARTHLDPPSSIRPDIPTDLSQKNCHRRRASILVLTGSGDQLRPSRGDAGMRHTYEQCAAAAAACGLLPGEGACVALPGGRPERQKARPQAQALSGRSSAVWARHASMCEATHLASLHHAVTEKLGQALPAQEQRQMPARGAETADSRREAV